VTEYFGQAQIKATTQLKTMSPRYPRKPQRKSSGRQRAAGSKSNQQIPNTPKNLRANLATAAFDRQDLMDPKIINSNFHRPIVHTDKARFCVCHQTKSHLQHKTQENSPRRT